MSRGITFGANNVSVPRVSVIHGSISSGLVHDSPQENPRGADE